MEKGETVQGENKSPRCNNPWCSYWASPVGCVCSLSAEGDPTIKPYYRALCKRCQAQPWYFKLEGPLMEQRLWQCWPPWSGLTCYRAALHVHMLDHTPLQTCFHSVQFLLLQDQHPIGVTGQCEHTKLSCTKPASRLIQLIPIYSDLADAAQTLKAGKSDAKADHGTFCTQIRNPVTEQWPLSSPCEECSFICPGVSTTGYYAVIICQLLLVFY